MKQRVLQKTKILKTLRFVISTLQRRSENFDVKSFSLSFWIKCCTELHRKGNTTHILIFKGIDGGYIDRTVLKLFKGTHNGFDTVDCSKQQGFKLSKVKSQ